MSPVIIADMLWPMAPEPVSIDTAGNIAPADDRPVLGWVRHSWKASEGPKSPCRCCGRGVRRGVQHHRHRGPHNPVLCDRCYDAIMADPGPGGWAGEGLN